MNIFFHPYEVKQVWHSEVKLRIIIQKEWSVQPENIWKSLCGDFSFIFLFWEVKTALEGHLGDLTLYWLILYILYCYNCLCFNWYTRGQPNRSFFSVVLGCTRWYSLGCDLWDARPLISFKIYLTVKSQNRPIEYTVTLYLGMNSLLVSLYTASSGLRDIASTSPEVGFRHAN